MTAPPCPVLSSWPIDDIRDEVFSQVPPLTLATAIGQKRSLDLLT